jgi:hypothetical protein
MLCLRYYGAKSNGCRDSGNCDDCVEENTLSLSAITGCSKLNTCCSCTICVRQPPSLVHLAAYTFLNYTLSLKRFTLNEETTYQQYVYAYRSPQFSISSRLPPEYPTVQLWFRRQQDSSYRYHRDCPGLGRWHSHMKCDHESYDDVLSDLIRLKDQFWCHHCERGLFFPQDLLSPC